jgi:hypothetical protein
MNVIPIAMAQPNMIQRPLELCNFIDPAIVVLIDFEPVSDWNYP